MHFLSAEMLAVTRMIGSGDFNSVNKALEVVLWIDCDDGKSLDLNNSLNGAIHLLHSMEAIGISGRAEHD